MDKISKTKGTAMKNNAKPNSLLLKRIERQNIMTNGLLKSGLGVLLLDKGQETLERQTKFVFSTTLSLLTTLRRRCRRRKKVSGDDARLFLLGLKWAAVGFMVGMGHRFCIGVTDDLKHDDVVGFIRRSLVLFKEILQSARFAIGAVTPPIIHEKGVSAAVFRFLCEMRTNYVIQRLLSQTKDKASRDDIMRMIPVVDVLEVITERTHDKTVEVDGSVLSLSFNGTSTKRRESVRKKVTVP